MVAFTKTPGFPTPARKTGEGTVAACQAASSSAIRYSIVLPAFNEGARLGTTLQRVLSYVASQGWNAEIIVVNDGSRDNTAEITRNYAEGHANLRLLENPGNRGKGYSVRNGMLNATGDVLLFSDADLSSPIEEAPKLLAAIERGADVAIGSRWLQSKLQTRRQSLCRQLLGRTFNLVPRLLLGLRYKDTQCGFKVFTRRSALAIFPRQRIERWGFDPELLFLARKFGHRVVEIPVAWSHSDGTRINVLRDGLRMVWEMVRVRLYSWAGQYDVPAEISFVKPPIPKEVPQ